MDGEDCLHRVDRIALVAYVLGGHRCHFNVSISNRRYAFKFMHVSISFYLQVLGVVLGSPGAHHLHISGCQVTRRFNGPSRILMLRCLIHL